MYWIATFEVEGGGQEFPGLNLYNSKIQRADLNGTNVEDLVVVEGMLASTGIAVDGRKGKMYWAGTAFVELPEGPGEVPDDIGDLQCISDPITSKIQRADIDGSNVEDIYTGLVNGIALDLTGKSSSDKKVCICHFPPGKPGKAKTICVGSRAAFAHLTQHGDTLGECSF